MKPHPLQGASQRRPIQEVMAVVATRDFLLRLTQPAVTPRVPGEVRREARALLRHFPPAEQLRPVLQQGLEPAARGAQALGSGNDAVKKLHFFRAIPQTGPQADQGPS